MSSRFDYIEYDETAKQDQKHIKSVAINMEKMIDLCVTSPQAKALALNKLEEAYMWAGKGIRDDQIERNKSALLQENIVNL